MKHPSDSSGLFPQSYSLSPFRHAPLGASASLRGIDVWSANGAFTITVVAPVTDVTVHGLAVMEVGQIVIYTAVISPPMRLRSPPLIARTHR